MRLMTLALLSVSVLLGGCTNFERDNPADPNGIAAPRANDAPLEPGEPQPEDHAEVSRGGVTLSWTCIDPNDDPLEYQVRLGTKEPLEPVSTQWRREPYQPLSSVLEPGTYLWRVEVRDGRGGRSHSRLWHFTTVNAPPDMPANPRPAHEALGVPVALGRLEWDCTDADDDPLEYQVYFGDTDPPSPKPQWVSAREFSLLKNLNPGTRYYWKVDVRDKHGALTEGPLWWFTTKEPIIK